jgi:hypothetical protein
VSRFSLVIFIVLGCSPTKPQTATDPLKLAEVVLGRGLEQYPNESQSHILFVQSASAYPNQPIKFLVIEKSSGKAVFEKSFRPGYVKWRDDRTIEYEDMPGIARQNDNNFIKTWVIPANN